ncbi:GGDEF domain-containing protein [Pleionea litopenaei]|uniref:diguanylate cyclase n=1 Tax=Pleionea litopenaei TaxID=3070815 RepID=A0AA51RR11_9GAMM|nr:GGDEF domain-containing protein [Pleionea sp. HL-JVS1]WMS86052.1 GGDEF domain-containing protein [Pleionea sp. HL-JVS1]
MSSDSDQDSPKFVGRLSLQSLTWLRDRQIPAHPIAYSVAFEYQHNIINELVKRVNEFEKEGELDANALDLLFREFVLTKYIDFDSFNKTITDLVDETGSAVIEARNQLKEYRNFLKVAKEQLKAITDQDIKSMVESLSENTLSTFKAVNSLESHLSNVMAEIRVLQKKYTQIQKQARQDQLTGLLNRNALQTEFNQMVDDEMVNTITLAVGDIDHFKQFNDNHGHTIGDKVIKLVADTLKSNLKGSDIISRYGGEEFVILLPNTKLNDGMKLMNNIREKISNLGFVNKATSKKIDSITMSFGLSELHAQDNFHSLFDRADKGLYRSKLNGRNRVHCETPQKI